MKGRNMEYIKILEELTAFNAVSGFEEGMSVYMKGLFEKYCNHVEIDKFYNVIGCKKGSNGNKKLLITAHFDEIGLLVKSIDENGYLKLAKIGGIDSKILLAHEVMVHGKKDIFGVIGAKPPHLLKPEETKKAVKLEDLYIDAGFDQESIKKFVSIGDPITLKSNPMVLNEKKFSSKALDNRCNMMTFLEIMERLHSVKHEADIYFVATTQEEIEAVGAKIATFNLEPDLAMVIDTCHGEIPDCAKEEVYPLGKGPAIAIGPNMHRKMTDYLIALAKKEEIPFQIDVEAGDSGTEAWVTQTSKCGVPTLLISIPVKYMHTAIETIHLDDIKNTSILISKFIQSLSGEMEEIFCF